MCYPKPGPRCSGYAARRLAVAEAAAAESSNDIEVFFAARDRVKEAQAEFDQTPAGLKALKLLLTHENTFDNQQRYETAQKEYNRKLALVKGQTSQTHTLANPAVSNTTSHLTAAADFQPADQPRHNQPVHELLQETAVDAEPWINNLTDNELAAARWMTDRGAVQINTHISGNNPHDKHDPAELETIMTDVDTALSKYESTTPQIVYRGIRQGMLPKHIADDYRIPNETKQDLILEQFPVGSTYQSGFYMPTTMQPEATRKFADIGVLMEIKTRHAAPISALSLFPKEAERLIPRNTQYKVIAVQQNVTYGPGKPVTVIQLEEI